VISIPDIPSFDEWVMLMQQDAAQVNLLSIKAYAVASREAK
jgi:hypothetical protein